MSTFTNLKNVCIAFEEELRNDSRQLFTARIGKPFEDEIADKMKDLSLFTAKLRLLEAKSISLHNQSTPALKEEDTLAAYEDAVTWKIIEQQTVKTITQTRDVRALLTTPDSKLDPQMAERKNAIITKLQEYSIKEAQLSVEDALLKKAEEEHHKLQSQWDAELGELRDLKMQAEEEEEEITTQGPLYEQMRKLIAKIEIMRWLINRLVTARVQGYDWLSDPDNRLQALKMARKPNTLEYYTGM